MGLDTVRASLALAVSTLFTDPSIDAETCGSCGGPLVLSATWRALRDFPICTRFVISEWCRLASVPSNGKRKHASMLRRISSLTRLCVALYQCGLLATSNHDDSELVTMLVHAMDMDTSVDRTVLGQVLQQRTLARGVRLRLFQWVLGMPSPQSNWQWVGEVARALQEELREASIARVRPTEASTTKSRKRGRGAMGTLNKGGKSAACERCAVRNSQNADRTSLLESLAKWKRGSVDQEVVEVIEGLIHVLNAPDVVQLFETNETRPIRISRSRPSRAQSNQSIRWDECDRVVQTLCMDAQMPMWKLAWTRERRRTCDASLMGTLDELIQVCMVADQFAYATKSSENKFPSLGFLVVRKMAFQTIQCLQLIVTIARAITIVAQRQASSMTTLTSNAVLPTRHQFVSYLQYLLNHDDIDPCLDMKQPTALSSRRRVHEQIKNERNESPQGSTSDLFKCVELVYTIVIESGKASDDYRRVLFALWFQLVYRLSSDDSVGARWSLFLDAVAQCCEELHTSSRKHSKVFEDFVVDVLVGIVVSGGTQIRAPDGCYVGSIDIPLDETSQSMLQALLGLIINTSQTPRLLAALITRLLMVVTRREEAQSSRLLHGSGFPHLMFQLLESYVSSSRDSQASSLSTVVGIVQAQTRTRRESRKLSRVLAGFLHEWDSYCKRHSVDIARTKPLQSESQEGETIGLVIAREQGIWHDLVRFYASDTTNYIERETPEFLGFVLGLLRSIQPDMCPAELEGSLFNIVTRFSNTITQTASRSDPEFIHHSNETIRRFIHTFELSTDGADCHRLVEMLRHEGRLEDLALNLKRWLGVLLIRDNTLPTETATKLVKLANRLVYWCPTELHAVKRLLVPVDTTLLTSLQIFSTAQSTQISVVRLTVMVRAYLSTTTVPDLVALTAALVEATLVSSTSSARDGLSKLMHAFDAFLVVEVVVEQLHDALMLVGDRTQARTIRNALAIINPTTWIVHQGMIGFSNDVFSVRSAERWLATLVLTVLGPESTAKSCEKAVEALLSCLESLLGHHDQLQESGMRKMSHACALNALLSTFELAIAYSDKYCSVIQRVQSIHQQLEPDLKVTAHTHAVQVMGSDNKEHLLLMLIQKKVDRSSRIDHQDELLHASRTVRVIRGTIINPNDPKQTGEWSRPIDMATMKSIAFGKETVSTHTTRLYLTFGSWVKGAFTIQQQLPRESTSADSTKTWETLFTEMILQFYLPVEFYGDMENLLIEWISTWSNQCQTLGRAIDLPPFQRSIMLQLLVTSNPWHLLIHSAGMLIGDNIPPVIGRLIMNHFVSTLDLVVLCSMRPLTYETITAMAEDISSLLERLLHQCDPTETLVHRLATVAPAIEAFVSVSLHVASRTPRSPLLDVVKRVGVLVRQLTHSEVHSVWWHELLMLYKRRYAHINRNEASRIFGELEANAYQDNTADTA